MSSNVGVRVQNLEASIKMLSKVDKGLRKEVSAVFRKKTILIKNEAFARSKTSPGVRRQGYSLTKGAYIRGASSKRAFVGINRASSAGRNGQVFAAEFGTRWATVPRGNTGKTAYVSQNSMKRRTFPVWRGNKTTVRGKNSPGWIMLPLLRKRVPQITKELEKELEALFVKSAKASGMKKVIG